MNPDTETPTLNALIPRHDNIAELLGVEMPSFESKYERQLLQLKLELKAYIQSVREAANLPADVPSDKVFLKYDEAGFPVLIGFNPSKPLLKTEVEQLIREYLSRHYCKFAEKRHAD